MHMSRLFWLLTLMLTGSTGLAQPNAAPQVLAPGYSELEYEAPAPGSYRLPPLKPAGDGEVLLSSGERAQLSDLLGDKVVILSFIYSTCSDANGCPLATYVLHRIHTRLRNQPEVAEHVRLISLSFDPQHDTPEVMRLYGNNFQGKGDDWRFLTTRSEKELAPILDAYGQSVQKEYDENGKPVGTFSHILRVFLIDRERRIRNIYSVSFLHPDVLLNDVRTVLMDEQGSLQAKEVPVRPRPAVDLLDNLRHPGLGLPPVPEPEDNPATPKKIQLGRKLFFDRRLSLNSTVSCAMCHVPAHGFANNHMATAVGIEGRTVRRNAPTVINSGYWRRLFHDGRETSLRRQPWTPLTARNMMGSPAPGVVIERLGSLRDYDGLFESAFGRGPGMETVGMALASYMRSLASGGSAFDRWRYGGDTDAMSPSAKRGFELFTGKGGCASCHTIGERHALFTDQLLHNTGLGWYKAMHTDPPKRRVYVAPGVELQVDNGIVSAVAGQPSGDLGLYELTEDPADRWKYKTPSLRNVALTAPYMHDGSLASLADVLEFYNRGGHPNEGIDPRIRPLNLNPAEQQDLEAFLRSLTGGNVSELIADAETQPVGDPNQELAATEREGNATR